MPRGVALGAGIALAALNALWIAWDAIHYDDAGGLRIAAQVLGLVLGVGCAAASGSASPGATQAALAAACLWSLLADAACAGRQDAWVLGVAAAAALAAAGGRPPVLAGLSVTAAVWLVLRTVDEADDFGMLRGLEQGDPGHGKGWWWGPVAVTLRLASFCGGAAAVRAAASAGRERHSDNAASHLAAIAVVEACARFDFDGAAEELEAAPVPFLGDSEARELLDALRSLVAAMRTGRMGTEPASAATGQRASNADNHAKYQGWTAGSGSGPESGTTKQQRRSSAGANSSGTTDSDSDTCDKVRTPMHVAGGTPGSDGFRLSIDLSEIRSRTATVLTAELSAIVIDHIDTPHTVLKYYAAAVESGRTHEASMLQHGDRLLFCWNGARQYSGHQGQACICAINMAQHLAAAVEHPEKEEGAQRRQQKWSLACATGPMLIGGDRWLAGQPVTLAAALATLARHLGCQAVASERVHQHARTQVHARPIDCVAISYCEGMPKDVLEVYELIGVRDDDEIPPECDTTFLEGFNSLSTLKFEDCKEQLMNHLCELPRDVQAYRMLRVAVAMAECSEFTTDSWQRQWYPWEDFEARATELPAELAAELRQAAQRRGSGGDGGDFAFGDFAMAEDSDSQRSGQKAKPRVQRKSIQHDKILRAQIREAEAEANAAQLAAWGLMPAEEESKKKTEEKGLPTKFDDQKGRSWFRGEKCLGKGAFGEVWLGMGADGGLVAVKTMRLPALVTSLTSPTSGPATTPKAPNATSPTASDASGAGGGGGGGMTAAARRRQARKQGKPPPQQSPAASPKADNHMQQIEDLLREVALMQSLRHDNVVAYFGSAVIRGHIMIVMEYLSGGSLDGILKEFGGKLATSSIQRYTRDCTSGLTFLHRHGIVHRDMKPHNTLLLIDGQCKLADFGASAELGQLAKTNQGVIGTPLYMSPEACRGSAEPKSDVWGLGVMVCQLFTNEIPYTFSDDEPFNPHTFMFRMSHVETFGPTIPMSMPPDARSFAQACLHRDLEQRWDAKALQRHKFVL